MAHLLKVALDEKKKSIAKRRSNLAGPFPARVTEAIISAFSGKCPLSSAEPWELRGSFVLTGSKGHCRHTARPSKLWVT